MCVCVSVMLCGSVESVPTNVLMVEICVTKATMFLESKGWV